MTERTLALIKPSVIGEPYKFTVRTQGEDGEDPEEEVKDTTKEVAIIERIKQAGFTIVEQKRFLMSKSTAEEFYSEHRGKPFFEKLTTSMSSAPVIAMVLEKEGAVAAWRELMGPTDPAEAYQMEVDKAPAPAPAAEAEGEGEEEGEGGEEKEASKEPEYDMSSWCLRAAFGDRNNKTNNATHGSDSAISSLREQAVIFPKPARLGRLALTTKNAEDTVSAAAASGFVVVDVRPSGAESVVTVDILGDPETEAALAADASKGLFSVGGAVAEGSVERTLALIKPGTADAHEQAIKDAIAAWDFEIVNERRVQLTRERAAEFYAEHAGKPFFDGLVEYMSSGPIVALVLARASAIKAWRQLIGPTNTEKARVEAPKSLRARFGVDGTRNACHGSDKPASATREAAFFFPQHRGSATNANADFMKRDVGGGKTLDDLIVEGCAQLCAAKPADPVSATRWLGEWLQKNNPNAPSVQ